MAEKTIDEEVKPKERTSVCHPPLPSYGLSGLCKRCYMTKWRHDNREHVNAEARKNSIKTVYGITWEEYEALLKKQEGKCAICRAPFLSRSHYRGTRIDHEHGTKCVRGLLCHGCNLLVGYLEKRKKFLTAAAAYLATS